jgi:putative ABC transport system permease protein
LHDRGLDSSLPLRDVQVMSELAHASTAERRLETYLLGGFAAHATLLAAIGLFGVLAFHVAQHGQELGVRLALGAAPASLLALVIRRGLVLLAAGLAVGIPRASNGTRHVLAAVRRDVHRSGRARQRDCAAVGVTLLACAVPARRAMRIDPLVVPRSD